MRVRAGLAVPSIAAAIAMYWALHRMGFTRSGVTGESVLWIVALVGPFLFSAAFAYPRRRNLATSLAFAILPAMCLAMPIIACAQVGFGEGCGYLLALAPIYLWPVVGVRQRSQAPNEVDCSSFE
jgi:FtsH-binding integral membrane protein